MPTSKNYKTDEGNTWVIGGKLVIENGAEVEGLPSADVPKITKTDDSTATDVETLKSDFNALLEKLRNTGLMER